MQLNIKGLARDAAARVGLRELDALVRAVGECRSKAEEDRIIAAELETLKQRLSDPRLDRTRGREYMVRVLYCEMLGHDATFALVPCLQFASDSNLLTKKVRAFARVRVRVRGGWVEDFFRGVSDNSVQPLRRAPQPSLPIAHQHTLTPRHPENTTKPNNKKNKAAYLALTQMLHPGHELVLLLVNTLLVDLRSDNFVAACAALTAACKLLGPDLVGAVWPVVAGRLLPHPREAVRKKAAMALHAFLRLDPSRTGPLAGACAIGRVWGGG
jgi:hypothetical protein